MTPDAPATLAAFVRCEAALDLYRKGKVKSLFGVRDTFKANGWDGKGHFMAWMDVLRSRAVAEVDGIGTEGSVTE